MAQKNLREFISFLYFLKKNYRTLWQRREVLPQVLLNFADLRRRRVNSRKWMFQYKLSQEELVHQRAGSSEFAYRPLISIVSPVFNPSIKHLKEMLASAKSQTYPHWEHVLVDDGSTDPCVHEILEGYSQSNPQVKVIFLGKNGGVAKASNRGLKESRGEYVCFLDQDDRLVPHALFRIVQSLNANRQSEFLYSDEALTDENGRVIQIFFRPKFSRNFFLSHPYFVHLVVIKRDLINRVGGFDETFPTSQDYDLFLKVISEISDQRVYHIPDVLYFWRKHQWSWGHQAIKHVMEYSKKALEQYLKREKIDGVVMDGLTFNTFRIQYAIQGYSLISIIIATQGRLPFLHPCIAGIEKKGGCAHFEVIIIHHQSGRECTSDDLRASFPQAQVIKYDGEFNYSEMNNLGVQRARGDYLLFLNDDVNAVSLNWIGAMLEHAQRREVGVVGAKLLYPDDRIQHAGVVLGLLNGMGEHFQKFRGACDALGFPNPGYLSSLVCVRECSGVTGACMMVRKDVFAEAGGFDPRLKIGFGDLDLCLRVKAKGYTILLTPYAMLYHHESISRKKHKLLMQHPEDSAYFKIKWREELDRGDPYYSPFLTLQRLDCSARLKDE